MSMMEFTAKEITVFRIVIFLNEALCQIKNFLGIYKIFTITNSTNLDFSKE